MPNYAEFLVIFKLTQKQYQNFMNDFPESDICESLKNELEEIKKDFGENPEEDETFCIGFNIDFTYNSLLDFCGDISQEAVKAKQLYAFLTINDIKYETDNDFD